MGDALTQFTTLNFERARLGMEFDIPVFLLQRAIRRAQSLRSLGQVSRSGRTYDAVTFADADGSQVGLHFAAQSGLLARVETLRDDAVDGDVTVAVEFDDYHRVRGVAFPSQRREWYDDALVRDGTLSVAVDTRPHDTLFAEPTGYVAPLPRGAEAEPVRLLAENVWLIQQLGNRVMFVAFDDHVLVFETPLPQSSAATVLDIVRRTVPGKPVRYVTSRPRRTRLHPIRCHVHRERRLSKPSLASGYSRTAR